MAANGPMLELRSQRVVLPSASGDYVVAPACITIEGTTITAVDRVNDPRPSSPGAAVHDFGDRLLTPAFVNGHVHLAMSAFRGLGGVEATRGNVVEDLYYTLERALSPADIRAFVRVGAYESLLAGVGFVWEHYYGGTALAEGLADTGLAGVVAPTLQDLEGPGVGGLDDALAATESIAHSSSLREQGIYAALGPHATDTVSDRTWRQVADIAARLGLPIHAHVAQSFEEFNRVWERAGTTPVGLLAQTGVLAGSNMLLVHGLYLSKADLERLDPSRHTLGFCPFSQLQFGFCADAAGWSEAGLPWCVATDCAASNDSMNLQKELRLVAGDRGLSTRYSPAFSRFLTTANLDQARAVQHHRSQAFTRHRQLATPAFLLSRVWDCPGSMHPQVKLGTIEPGALANLLVWDPQHPSMWPMHDPLAALAMGDTCAAIESMMVAGRFIGGLGGLQQIARGPDYRDARVEADRRLRDLLERLGLGPR